MCSIAVVYNKIRVIQMIDDSKIESIEKRLEAIERVLKAMSANIGQLVDKYTQIAGQTGKLLEYMRELIKEKK